LTCPGGTVYRNYFHRPNNRQINNLEDVEALLSPEKYWNMKNGYCLPLDPKTSMYDFGERLNSDEDLRVSIKNLIKVGVHWDTEVLRKRGDLHNVCQVFCSALPVTYAKTTRSAHWAPFASVCLESAFESTLCIASIIAAREQRRVKVYLTLLGGGAFGNRKSWIYEAIQKANEKFAEFPLDVYLVHYTSIPGDAKQLER